MLYFGWPLFIDKFLREHVILLISNIHTEKKLALGRVTLGYVDRLQHYVYLKCQAHTLIPCQTQSLKSQMFLELERVKTMCELQTEIKIDMRVSKALQLYLQNSQRKRWGQK